MNSRYVKFAIGCFHFGLKKVYPGGMTGENYLEELSETLENIPNINNLDIFVDDDFKSHRIEATAKFTALDEGKYFFPPPTYGFDISFDIYIPERLQFELFPVMSSAIHAEKFRVYIRGAYHFPVTFVELIDAKNVSEPSMAVAVIREFLR